MRIGDTLICETGKDGGPESKVDGFWLFRHKKLFTVALLRFRQGSREAYHSHAFNSVSWLLSGGLHEYTLHEDSRPGANIEHKYHKASWRPIVTLRDTFHKVYGRDEDNWVLTFRGPWADRWRELVPGRGLVTLTHNRVEVK